VKKLAPGAAKDGKFIFWQKPKFESLADLVLVAYCQSMAPSLLFTRRYFFFFLEDIFLENIFSF